jgi:putative DNA primase/helicase
MMKTSDAARGKWKGILLTLNIAPSFLTGKHGPCPFCGGHDRFRWDNAGGKGSFICSQCGAGDGFEFLMRARGWTFMQAAREVDQVVGNIQAEPIRGQADAKHRAARLTQLWREAKPLSPDDLAFAYLSARVSLPARLPPTLRFASTCPVPGRHPLPALISMVQDHEGQPANIHRTFLGPQGKAQIETPRAMMPGPIPDGSAIRLFADFQDQLGIAEGIETAFAAAAKFNVPVWSAINSAMLQKWRPPPGVTKVTIFGDADKKYGGQEAAFALAHRLAARQQLEVEVKLPARLGCDWADEID